MLALAALALLVAAGSDVEKRIDEHASHLVGEAGVASVVVGTLADGEPRVRGYGQVTHDGGAVPDGRTVYEIGSITKTFTGILLALAVERGEAALDDPVQEHLPEGVELQEWEGEPVRLVHLATHTSGLPRMPVDFRPASPANPYADFDIARLYAGLLETRLSHRPGSASEYSNLGMGLLGHALELASGADYEALVRERVALPLGMKDTVVVLTPALRERLAPGYGPDGSPRSNWDLAALAGAGALRSTADDLLRYARANLDPDSTPIASAIRASHEIRHELPEGGGIALAWHSTPEGATLWHNGGTGGYRSMLVLHPGREVAVVVLANTPSELVDSLAGDVLGLLLAEDG